MGELRFKRVLLKITKVVLGIVALALLSIVFVAHLAFNTGGVPMGALEKSVKSKDSTTIAYERTGTGPIVILVSAALADRGGTRRLAKHLSEHFTVINYDRRGRGASTNTQPYAPSREVEDIEALINDSGGAAFLFGSSSGSVLALDAANQLGTKVRKLFMYEPPFIVDNSRPAIPDGLSCEISGLVAEGRRNDAVRLFFTKGMGIPGPGVTAMRFLMPGWSRMAGMAQTVPYDLSVLAGTQTGQPLPINRWVNVHASTLICVGGRSEPFFHIGAKALSQMLPNAEYRSLAGMNHGSVLLAPKNLAATAKEFFLGEK